MSSKQKLRELLKSKFDEQRKLKRDFNWLICEFKDWKSMKGDSWSEKDMNLYVREFNDSGLGQYEEGRFHLEYETLQTRVRKNREERSKLIVKLKKVKDEIKEIHRKFNEIKK